MTDLDQFRELFWQGFGAPALQTDWGGNVYFDAVPPSEVLAGPLYSINEYGNCDYVFGPNETRFAGVSNAESFLNWCLEVVNDYRNAIQAHAAQNEVERKDQEYLLAQGDIMEQLSLLAHSILKQQGR